MPGAGVLLLLAGCWACQGVAEGLSNLTMAILLPRTNRGYPWAWPRVGPAIHMAIERINRDPALLPDLRVQTFFGDSEDKDGNCSDSTAPVVAVDLQFTHHPEVFLGPGCIYTAAPVARFTAHWKVPLITVGAAAFGFNDKSDVYQYTTRTGLIPTKLGQFVGHIHQRYNWSSRAMIVYRDSSLDDRPCFFTMEGLYMELLKFNLTVLDLQFKDKELTNYTSLIHDIKQKGRIIYMCCYPDMFRQLMIQAWREGLCSGDYAFFYVDIWGASLQGAIFPDPQRPWYRGDPDDAKAREAFKAVMIITYKEPDNPEYREFLANLSRYSEAPFYYRQESTLMNALSASFHDSVLLYAHAVNETRANGYSMKNASAVTSYMRNKSFYGASGFVKIDDNGDRENDFSLWDMYEPHGTFQIVYNYNGTLRKIVPLPGREIEWPGNRIPRDVPPCGFDHSDPKCKKSSFTILEILSIVICFILLIITVSSIFIYRKLRLEKELAAELWRIRWEDIHTSNLEKNLRRAGSKLTLSLRGSNYGSLLTTEGQFQIYAKTAYYKGNIIAVKHINRKRIELTRKVLFELKHVRNS